MPALTRHCPHWAQRALYGKIPCPHGILLRHPAQRQVKHKHSFHDEEMMPHFHGRRPVPHMYLTCMTQELCMEDLTLWLEEQEEKETVIARSSTSAKKGDGESAQRNGRPKDREYLRCGDVKSHPRCECSLARLHFLVRRADAYLEPASESVETDLEGWGPQAWLPAEWLTMGRRCLVAVYPVCLWADTRGHLWMAHMVLVPCLIGERAGVIAQDDEVTRPAREWVMETRCSECLTHMERMHHLPHEDCFDQEPSHVREAMDAWLHCQAGAEVLQEGSTMRSWLMRLISADGTQRGGECCDDTADLDFDQNVIPLLCTLFKKNKAARLWRAMRSEYRKPPRVPAESTVPLSIVAPERPESSYDGHTDEHAHRHAQAEKAGPTPCLDSLSCASVDRESSRATESRTTLGKCTCAAEVVVGQHEYVKLACDDDHRSVMHYSCYKKRRRARASAAPRSPGWDVLIRRAS